MGEGLSEKGRAIGIMIVLFCSLIVSRIIFSYLWLSFYMLLFVGWCECVDGTSWMFYSL